MLISRDTTPPLHNPNYKCTEIIAIEQLIRVLQVRLHMSDDVLGINLEIDSLGKRCEWPLVSEFVRVK